MTSAGKPENDFKIIIHTYPCNRRNCVSCSCDVLSRVDVIKYLGLHVDSHLNWSHHISGTAVRIRRLIYAFKNLRTVANRKLIIQTYKALGECIINYCICSWGGAAKKYMIELERAQRALLKVSLRLPFRYPTTDLYNDSMVFSVRKLFIVQSLRRYHRSVVPSLPVSNKRVVQCPLPNLKSTFARRHFVYGAPLIYNKMKAYLKLKSVRTFSDFTLKKIIADWLRKLNYDETENVLIGWFSDPLTFPSSVT